MAVDSSHQTEFKVTVQAIGNGLRFTAVVQEDSVEQKYQRILQQNGWGKDTIILQINAVQRITDNSIIRAAITKLKTSQMMKGSV